MNRRQRGFGRREGIGPCEARAAMAAIVRRGGLLRRRPSGDATEEGPGVVAHAVALAYGDPARHRVVRRRSMDMILAAQLDAFDGLAVSPPVLPKKARLVFSVTTRRGGRWTLPTATAPAAVGVPAVGPWEPVCTVLVMGRPIVRVDFGDVRDRIRLRDGTVVEVPAYDTVDVWQEAWEDVTGHLDVRSSPFMDLGRLLPLIGRAIGLSRAMDRDGCPGFVIDRRPTGRAFEFRIDRAEAAMILEDMGRVRSLTACPVEMHGLLLAISCAGAEEEIVVRRLAGSVPTQGLRIHPGWIDDDRGTLVRVGRRRPRPVRVPSVGDPASVDPLAALQAVARTYEVETMRFDWPAMTVFGRGRYGRMAAAVLERPPEVGALPDGRGWLGDGWMVHLPEGPTSGIAHLAVAPRALPRIGEALAALGGRSVYEAAVGAVAPVVRRVLQGFGVEPRPLDHWRFWPSATLHAEVTSTVLARLAWGAWLRDPQGRTWVLPDDLQAVDDGPPS